MCNACGYPARPGPWIDAGLTSPMDRRRALHMRAALLTRALRSLGLRAHASASGLVLAHVTGASAVAADPADLWATVERLAGRPFDPLADG
jgi:hypothetical protein